MALDRVEREKVTEAAKQRLRVLKTMGDLFEWYGANFSLLGARILGKLINDEHLRLESVKRETARRMKELRDEREAIEDKFAYSPKNMNRQGRTQTKAPSEWKRQHDNAVQDAKDLAAQDARADDVEFQTGPGERDQRK